MREGLAWRLPSRFLPGVPGRDIALKASAFHPRRRLSQQSGNSRLVATASRRVDIDRGQLGPVIAMPVLSRRQDETRESVGELKHRDLFRQQTPEGLEALRQELSSNVVFVRRESGGVLQDSVGEDSSLDDERELMACVEASPATCR